MKRIKSILGLIAIFCICAAKATAPDSLSTPKIEGTIRAKYEYNSSLDAHRFQVRNARFSVSGSLKPMLSYKAEIDLSDEGVTKMLDAYIRYQYLPSCQFTIGQQKIPFSTDNLRSPHQFYFANRSFIGKQLTGLRDVGATWMFQQKKGIPFDIQAGIYNGDGLYNQQAWKKALNYAVRTVVYPTKNISFSLNYNAVQPRDLRMNLWNVGIMTDVGKLHLESEFLYKTYTDHVFQDTKGFFLLGAYDIETPGCRYIQKIRPLLRYDSMTDNNNGVPQSNGSYVVTDLARERITGGLTLCLNKKMVDEIRLNYENYSHKNGFHQLENKFVAEFVVRF